MPERGVAVPPAGAAARPTQPRPGEASSTAQPRPGEASSTAQPRPTGAAVWTDAFLKGLGAAIVAVFCYSTAKMVPRLPEAYWAPIAAVVVLYPDREATRKAAAQRFVGTIIGSLIGWGGAVWWHENVLIYGIAVLLAVGVCWLLRLEAASRLCAVAVTVITVIPRPEPAYWVAFHRFIEVSYGVACALGYIVLVDLARSRFRRGTSHE